MIFANDGSKTQLEKILGLLRNRSIHYGTLSDRVGLGAAVGGPPLSAVAVTNPSFAEQLRRRVPSASGGTGRRIENGR